MWQCASQIWPQGNAIWPDGATAKADISASDWLFWEWKMYWNGSCSLTQEENLEVLCCSASPSTSSFKAGVLWPLARCWSPSTGCGASNICSESCSSSCCSGSPRAADSVGPAPALQGQAPLPLLSREGARGSELLHRHSPLQLRGRRRLPSSANTGPLQRPGRARDTDPSTHLQTSSREGVRFLILPARSNSSYEGLGHHQLMGRYSENCFHSWTPEMLCNEL